MKDKHSNDWMKLQHGALQPQAQRNLFERPPFVHPVRHDLHNEERHGDGRAFKVARFARRVFGHHGDGYVEARKSGEAAEDEEGK